MSLKIEQGTFIGMQGVSHHDRQFNCRYDGVREKFRQYKLPGERTFSDYSSVQRIILEPLSKWDITQWHNTNGNISMRSPYGPSLWVGAEITGSVLPVLWRLIPADSNFY